MWTLIKKTDYQNYCEQYLKIMMYQNEIILHENEEYYFLPRLFYKDYPSPKLIKHIDASFIPKKINVTFKGELREHQHQIVNAMQSSLIKSHGGILKSRPGSGKTFMSIYTSCQFGYKTLIILDQTNIIDQWVEDTIFKYTDSTDVGIIQGKKFDIDHDFTIAMVQTLTSKVKNDLIDYYTKMKDAGFGFVIFDECHAINSSEQFAKASLFINTENIIGLSASPFPNELQSLFMHQTIGKIFHEYKDYDLSPTINFIKYSSGLNNSTYTTKTGKESKVNTWINYAGDLIQQRSRYNSIMHTNNKFFNICLQLNKELISNGHTVANVVFTKNTVEILSDFLNGKGIDCKQFYSEERELEKETQKSIISTFKFVSKAFDWSNLSALIIGLPISGKKSLIQLIGRILRSKLNKQTPVVYYPIDIDFEHIFGQLSITISILKKEFGNDIKINTIEM